MNLITSDKMNTPVYFEVSFSKGDYHCLEEFDSVREAERSAVTLANLNQLKVYIHRCEFLSDTEGWTRNHYATVWPSK